MGVQRLTERARLPYGAKWMPAVIISSDAELGMASFSRPFQFEALHESLQGAARGETQSFRQADLELSMVDVDLHNKSGG